VHRQLGRDGEYTAYFLSEFGSETVENKHIHHPKAKSTQLIHQTEAWLGEISPGTRLYTNSHEELDLVSLQFAFASATAETNHYRATNVGFGISYVLPIIVAALSNEGGMLLIENPEAHLHPIGQRKIAELLANAASKDVQIIVETHSDHFLNGLRLSVHSGNVAPDDIALHYFEREQTKYAIRAKVSSPKIDRNGRIDFWPEGFFDESEKALRELLRPAPKL
jgi:predicted ATPase